jgi:hypothetical protein
MLAAALFTVSRAQRQALSRFAFAVCAGTLRVSPNVGQKNGLNKVVVGTFEMGTDSSRFPLQVENHLICLPQKSIPSLGPKTENRLQANT